ncbi:MAG: helix-turn-helix domain-containing protein [Nitrospiraceae bacterium]|nr:helix-turn-helix domain-containing protein [Nitrospiraceae bacterium]
MSNIAKLLKETIERAARKQARAETEALRKASGQHRKIIAELSGRVKNLEREIAQLHKRLPKPTLGDEQVEAGNLRFSAKRLPSLRKRLGLTAKECGILIGVSGWTIGSWERGQTRPKKEQIAAIAELRKIGKRDAQRRIEELAQK